MEQELLQEIDWIENDIKKTPHTPENKSIINYIREDVFWVLDSQKLAFNINVQVAKSMLIDLFEEKYWSLYQ